MATLITSLNFQPVTQEIGVQPINSFSATQNHPIGHRIRAVDAVYGEAEFVYLPGLASTALQETVLYDQYAGTTKRAVAGDRGPLAVAMSANILATTYGWYCVRGSVPVKAAAGDTTTATGQYLTSTPGTVDDAIVVGDGISGMRVKTALDTPIVGYCVMELDYPCANGFIASAFA